MIPLLLIFLTASPAQAETLTRDGAVREAIGSSPAFAKSQAAAEEQDWKRAETFSYFLPTLQATASRYFVKQLEYNDLDFGGSPAHIPLIYPATRASLNFNWNLFDGFGNFYRYSGARRMSEAARDEADWARFQTEEDALLHFNEAIAARELQSVAEQNVATLKDHLDQVSKTRKGGLATRRPTRANSRATSKFRSPPASTISNSATARTGRTCKRRRSARKPPISSRPRRARIGSRASASAPSTPSTTTSPTA